MFNNNIQINIPNNISIAKMNLKINIKTLKTLKNIQI